MAIDLKNIIDNLKDLIPLRDAFNRPKNNCQPNTEQADLQEFLEIAEKYQFSSTLSVSNDIYAKYQYDGDLLKFFTLNKNHAVHKWHHYIPLYDRYFAPFRNQKVKFLEIGVSEGGSLQMWRNYFGNEAIIYGVDINPECEKYNGQAGQVRIGSQDDFAFLESVISEMGGIDIILDDGSHQMAHIPKTLKFLFPKLNFGGIYMIEDLHTSYWRHFGGGYDSKDNFFNLLPSIIHNIHRWYHKRNITNESIIDSCTGIHIHDSILVLEKNIVYAPTHSKLA